FSTGWFVQISLINDLSDDIICHILSFLPFNEATSTSVLSKRWRYLFAYRTNLHLDDQEVGGGQSFIDFVDVFCPSTSTRALLWFKTLKTMAGFPGFSYLGPKSKNTVVAGGLTAFVFGVYFYTMRAVGGTDELQVAIDKFEGQKPVETDTKDNQCPWSKKLTYLCTERSKYWDMTLDTPSLAYLEYSDIVSKDYPFVNLDSLVEAKLDLYLTIGYSNPTNLFKGLRNVETLELSGATTSLVKNDFREVIPVFSKLSRLSITHDPLYYCWEHLPILLEKSPNLQTLVLKGPYYAREYEQEFGHSCPVKVLKITEYRGMTGELENMKHLLKKLSCLELVKVRAYAINDDEKSRITKDLLMVPRPSSCKIQIKFVTS
ncbi:PREDICTED: F-box protein At4g22280-like, partial [Camelina sativa]|uniref:F-box protein At4g22280-like n=1 Tax=Camelina sativa TaxID=90675 RepID=A0ABM1QQN6_CAMSA